MARPTALVVGGSSGIGLASAELLIARGVDVIVIGRNAEKLASAEKTLKAAATGGAQVSTWTADLSDMNKVEAEVLAKVRALPETVNLQYLVNAAGIFVPKPFLDHSVEDYRSYMSLNEATFFVTQEVAKRMKTSNGGSIVNVGSMWAKQSIKATPSSAYSMAKAGLHSLTQHLAMELADHKIRVNAVSPAVVRTPIYKAFIPDDQLTTTLDSLNAMHPIGKTGTAEQVARSIDFLLDNTLSPWTTGAILDVDGGIMAGRN